MISKCLLLVVFVWTVNGEEVFKYKQLMFDLTLKSDANIYNSLPTGLARHGNRLYVGVARTNPGIPSTLNFIDLTKANQAKNQSPLLVPYPDSTYNELHPEPKPDSGRFISVHRPRVDECQRLWIVDTGVVETPDNFIVYQLPSIRVIDLKTDMTLHRYEIPKKLVENAHGLVSITVDVDPTSCEDAFAYIPDMQTYRLIVYDYRKNQAWRFITNYFYPHPFEGDYMVKGNRFQWDDGIVSVALGKRNTATGYRTAYFHAASSYSEYQVSTEVLKNEANVRLPYQGHHFKVFGRRPKSSNVGIHAYHPKTGVMFNAELQKFRVTCTNISVLKLEKNVGIVLHDAANLIFPADLSIDGEDNLWFLSNALPIHIYSKLNTSDYNFRIWRMNIEEAIKNTVCSQSF